jgi:hypothetical protein
MGLGTEFNHVGHKLFVDVLAWLTLFETLLIKVPAFVKFVHPGVTVYQCRVADHIRLHAKLLSHLFNQRFPLPWLASLRIS